MSTTKHMPSAAKLVAATSIAIVGWIGSEQFKPLMPPQTDFGYFNIVNFALGFLCGWVVLGTRIGRGYYEAIMGGLTTVFALVFWAVLAQSINEMLRLALERRYDGPFEAITEIFTISFDFGSRLADVNLIVVLLVGSFISAICAEWASNRFF